jgi:hypothetical protein
MDTMTMPETPPDHLVGAALSIAAGREQLRILF